MSNYETRTTRVTVLPEGEPIFNEHATNIEIVDEAAGEFLRISQESGHIGIEPEQWPVLKAAIEAMLAECRF